MLQKFIAYISKYNLFNSNDKILVAVSGGIDSVVMCELLYQAKVKFGIAHCNFQLRRKESDRDEVFVKKLAVHYKVDFFSQKFETAKFSAESGISIQMAARNLRFEWLQQTRKQNNYNCIAIAHHKDDSIETFFINLLRGTGIAGLHGILPKQNNIVRPLLFASRKEIESFYKKNKLTHREDSSNKSDKYLRNKIRHHIIPALKKINPNIEDIISKDIEKIKDTEHIYREAITEKKQKVIKKENGRALISIDELKRLNPVNTYLFEFLREYNFTSAVTKDIISSLKNQSGKNFYSSSHRLLKDRNYLIITNKKEDKPEIEVRFSVKKKTSEFKIPANKNIICLDYDLLKLPLTIRRWKPGDFFYPLGMKRKKKVSDFFIDNKIPLLDKERARVLVSGNDLVWIIGMRIDDRFKITDRTRKLYLCELIEE